ncbi:acyl-CoA dehydrogenase family protein [Desulfosudis oleivorans]|uniref:Acyl-CoA dehydrogenase domain protein n=1 Tax=Desulfosudis oleivorans (strain DSM 6200 / JCM 39069 / Hxd3) TaxID=96561 RepID=A8ZZQ4_DESOH|nr:acyl-CoA dehydrogenase family protein [Desulfosudis oleivorans]ABW68926.1 acyl-CoA dehydrogenase domain protein [Desulfosudis oleivorans Hxd3]
MLLLNPKKYQDRNYPDERSKEIMLKTIAFFENKGMKKMKEDTFSFEFTHDFAEFCKKERIFETLFLPKGYGDDDQYYSTYRMYEFSEITGFYGAAYWYMYHVSTLGLDPVFLGDNEELKHRAVQQLRENPLCAFGLSEKEHGADIYSSEMKLYPQDDGTYLARGTKYYIGNGNEASTITVFGKIAGTDDYVFFVVDSHHEKFECVQNVIKAQNFVSEFILHDYPITDADISARGPKAWDDMLNTINICKFNIGSGATGIVTHSFYEAINHAAHRNVYGKFVTEFPHVKRLFMDSFCRLAGMKLFGLRATDYMRAASAEDKRYMLYNPIMKMKVAIQGEEVHEMLWDIIAAKGFEKDNYFSQAVVELKGFPKLEGTRHVNMALIAKLLPNFFFNPKEYPEIPRLNGPENDDYLFQQGTTRGYGKIQFHDYNIAYNSVDLPNINVFKEQIKTFADWLMISGMELKDQMMNDFDFLLGVGEMFTLVAYGQLIIESAAIEKIDNELLNQIFDVFVRDFSKYAVDIHGKPTSTQAQKDQALKIIKSPVIDNDQFARVLEKHVYSLVDAYHMNP